MKKILEVAKNSVKYEHFVIVTVISSEGSTPRKTAAAMLVCQEGCLAGSIGGGVLEKLAIETAYTFLNKNIGKVVEYSLNNENAGGIGMICGGTTEILYTPIRDIKKLLWTDENMCFSLPFDGTMPFFTRENTDFPGVNREKSYIFFPFSQGGRVILFGAGHVSQALAHLLHSLDFSLLIVDDRTEFCNKNRFPQGELKLIPSFSELISSFLEDSPQKKDAICILTRGHMGDLDVLRFALGTAASYIGVMGSRSKRGKVFAILDEEGYSDLENRIKTPIGLDIQAETPEELAVSIAGELIAWRASQGKGD